MQGVLTASGFLAAKHAASRASSKAANALHLHAARLLVPHANGAIALDGDMDDPGWLHATARTYAFVGADGTPARPYSDARFVWGDGHLYVALYASDEDIRASRSEPGAPLWLEDSFHLAFSDAKWDRILDLSPLGTLTDALRPSGGQGPLDYSWSSGAHVSHELDGTANNPADEDEEWVLEMAIPFDSLGVAGKPGDEIALTIHRCDTPKHAKRVCGAWNGEEGGVLVLE